jgi:hypothetical protein
VRVHEVAAVGAGTVQDRTDLASQRKGPWARRAPSSSPSAAGRANRDKTTLPEDLSRYIVDV